MEEREYIARRLTTITEQIREIEERGWKSDYVMTMLRGQAHEYYMMTKYIFADLHAKAESAYKYAVETDERIR